MRTRLQRLLPALALAGLLGATACTDGYGRYDPVATGLLGAGVGAAAGLAIGAAATRPAPRVYYAPPPRYGWGYGRPAYRPHYGYGYGHGWGYRPRYW